MACRNCEPRLDTAGRNRIEPGWPGGGMVSRPVGDRHFDVQVYTGRPVSTVPAGRWNRGSVVRWATPEIHPNVGPLYMRDTTDPIGYTTVVSTQRKRGIVARRRKRG